MRSSFADMAVFQHQNLVTIINGAQSMRDKYTGSRFLLDDAVDVLQESLFCVRIQRGSLNHSQPLPSEGPGPGCTHRLIKEEQRGVLQNQP